MGAGELGNLVTIPIAALSACTDEGVPQQILEKIDAGADMTLGALAIARLRDTGANVTVETASGFIARTKAAKFALPVSGPKFGYCRVYDRSYNVGGLDPSYPDAFLDAGISLFSAVELPQPVALARTSGPVGPFYAYSVRPFETGLTR